MSYILRAVDNDGNHMFYTGQAGMNWLSYCRENAFEFATKEAADWRATGLNKMSMVHGYCFFVRRAKFGTAEKVS